jgi:hypothetical protein
MGFLATEWQDGPGGALGMGLKHGGYCLGSLYFWLAKLRNNKKVDGCPRRVSAPTRLKWQLLHGLFVDKLEIQLTAAERMAR